ncbi:uncharacterized protein [Argopecten irradians]|uniref:uncharacterized protein isoform X2 n=1 Tax=Argopecten irradians TaxID=31199 RepID=UPI00371D49CC
MAFDRFTELDESDLKRLLEKKDSESTKKIVKASVAVLQNYLEAKGKRLQEIETASDEECDDILRKFYAETRKEDGTRYAKKSLVSLRYGIQKHFIRTREQDIINDKVYFKSNETFKAVLLKLKEDGIGESVHTEPVTVEDMAKLYGGPAFDTRTPEGLQRKVMFECLYYFCSRGRENIRGLKKSSFVEEVNLSGRKYIALVRTIKTKKNDGEDEVDDILNEPIRMYDRPGNPNCPVASFKKYVSKLHTGIESFWQRPRKNVCEEDPTWYEGIPVGKNAIYSYMKKLSQDFHLSKRYTNLSVRATSIAKLDHYGVETRHVLGVSGHHRPEPTTKNHTFWLSDEGRCLMSDILSGQVDPKAKCVKRCSAAAAGGTSSYETMANSHVEEQNNIHINRLPLQSVPELPYSNSTNGFAEKQLPMMTETKMDRMEERENIEALLKKAVLSLCQEKYQNPIEVDALICVTLTPTNNHVVKIHEKVGNWSDKTSGMSFEGEHGDIPSAMYSTEQNPKPKSNGRNENVLMTNGTGDSETMVQKQNTEILPSSSAGVLGSEAMVQTTKSLPSSSAGILGSEAIVQNTKSLPSSSAGVLGSETVSKRTPHLSYQDLGQIVHDKDSMYYSTDASRKDNSVGHIQPTPVGLLVPCNKSPMLVYPISTSNGKTLICRKRKLDQPEIQHHEEGSQNYLSIIEQREKHLSYHRGSSVNNNDESNGNQTPGENLTGVVIKEEPPWDSVGETQSKWPSENPGMDGGNCELVGNTPTQCVYSSEGNHEVPLEMSVTSIKEEPQDSDPDDSEMAIDRELSNSDSVRHSDNMFTNTSRNLSEITSNSNRAEHFSSESKDIQLGIRAALGYPEPIYQFPFV